MMSTFQRPELFGTSLLFGLLSACGDARSELRLGELAPEFAARSLDGHTR
jgi:hypothetical protein